MKITESKSWSYWDYGQPFKVEVKHWIGESGENKWNVYAYLFPAFPGYDIFEDSTLDCPFVGHSHCSHVKFTREDSGAISCKCYGWDYQHDGDDRFSRYGTTDEAWEVFADAKRLIVTLADTVTLPC